MGEETHMTARRHRGSVLVYTAIVMFVLIGFVGLAVDWGYMTWTALKLQNAADASALAGAQQVWWSHLDARNAALTMASNNEAGGGSIQLDSNLDNSGQGDVVIGKYDTATKTFTPTEDHTQANAVRVVARRTQGSVGGPLPLLFGPIFQKNAADVWRTGTAVAIGGPAQASVIALNTKDPNSFYVYGNGYMDLGDGAAQVNSSSGSSSVFQGTQITFKAGEVNMVGDYNEKGNPDLNSVDLNSYQPPVSDPLASLPAPVPGAPMSPAKISGTSDGVQKTFNPGYYPQGLQMNNGENVFLNPGVYTLENGSTKKPSLPAFLLNGHCTLTGYGVMFYIKYGSVQANGTGDVHLTPPPGGTYKGIQFFQARDNTQLAQFNGTGLFTGTSADIHGGAGTMYFPAATIEVGGTGDMYVDSIIADKIVVYGDGHKYVTKGYDGRKGGDVVYLVE
jgi:Flp pilus assembly protein TadG